MSVFGKGNLRAAKLTPMDVLKIRELYNQGMTQRALGDMFGVTTVTIGRIVRGESWRQYRQPISDTEIEASQAELISNTQISVEELFKELGKAPPVQSEADAVDKFMQSRREAQSEQPNDERGGTGGSPGNDNASTAEGRAEDGKPTGAVPADSEHSESAVSPIGADRD